MATNVTFGWLAMLPMSDPAMPLAPKLACRTRRLGGCEQRLRTNSGAAMVAAPAFFRNVRREERDMAGSSGRGFLGGEVSIANQSAAWDGISQMKNEERGMKNEE